MKGGKRTLAASAKVLFQNRKSSHLALATEPRMLRRAPRSAVLRVAT